MACHRKFKKCLACLVLFIMLLIAGPVKAEEISVATEFVMSGNIDPVLASRVNSQTTLYRVEAGDTLWGISRKYKVDWELIAAMNDLKGTYLTSGQILVLPVIKEEVHEEVYRVCQGDTLTDIARRFEVSLKELIATNSLKDPDVLLVGQEIKIPNVSKTGVSVFKTYNRQIASRGRIFRLDWPVIGKITSRFGPRGKGFHHGLDIAAPAGTVIKSAQAGKVVFSGWKNRVYGYAVILDHSNGLMTMYAHNSVNLAKKGQRVAAGQVIARVGDTGNATGPHVHFAVFQNGKAVDPERYLNPQR